MFEQLFGFEPPKAVTEIKYKDHYTRFLMNGGWGRWIRFTYSEEVFSEILKDQGYKQRDELHFVGLEDAAAPKWWPKVDQSKITIYLRSDKDPRSLRDTRLMSTFGMTRTRILSTFTSDIGTSYA